MELSELGIRPMCWKFAHAPLVWGSGSTYVKHTERKKRKSNAIFSKMVTDKKLIRRAGKMTCGHNSHRHRHMCIRIRSFAFRPVYSDQTSPRQLDYSYLNSSYTLAGAEGCWIFESVCHSWRLPLPRCPVAPFPNSHSPIHTPNIIWME